MDPEANEAREAHSGLNVIGHVSGNLGLGVAARNTLHALVEGQRPFVAIDIDPGAGCGGHDDTYASWIHTPAEAPYPVNLFQLNPNELATLVLDRPPWLDLEHRLNACVPFWELPRLPVKTAWIPILDAVDVVLAPTTFVADAVRASVPGATVWHYPQAAFLPEGVAADRRRFGLPDAGTLFFMSLDVNSSLSRKNPAAAAEAFLRAFGADEHVHLVVKIGSSASRAWTGDGAREIRRLLASSPRIIVVDREMTYRDVLALNASCDAYVSLHRAEGLGLNLMEAMSLGKPVIATSWSGNMDFMSEENSCLVGYGLIPVVAEHAAYRTDVIGPGQVWADPDVDEAARWMRRLADDSGLRATVGARAAADMASRRAESIRGEVYARLEAAAGTLDGANVGEREVRWARLRRALLPFEARRAAGRALRALGLRR